MGREGEKIWEELGKGVCVNYDQNTFHETLNELGKKKKKHKPSFEKKNGSLLFK